VCRKNMRREIWSCRRSFMLAPVNGPRIHFSAKALWRTLDSPNPSADLRNVLAESARALGYTVHNGGTYVNMDGPAFSTRAESEFNHRNGFDVIAMTNLPEAKLAREAEIALATMAMITDYDSWKIE